jgi:agmatinase
MTYPAHPYNGVHTFLNAPMGDDGSARIAFLGVPFTEGVSNRPGANFAPNAIRAASKMLCEGIDGLVDLNDVILTGASLDINLDLIQNKVTEIINKGIYPLIAGGDHTITLAVLRAMKAEYGRVRLVHFDAHPDTWSDVFGKPMGHGTFLRNALDENLVDGSKSIMIGIRCPMGEDIWDYTNKSIGRVITAGEVFDVPSCAPEKLVEWIAADTETPTYLTFDIDVLDPPSCPGTGTPEAFGLLPYHMKKIIAHKLMRNVNWIGMDIVEVNPLFDVSEITSLTAATLMYYHASLLNK